MKFRELTECPFCGHDEFYSKLSVRGTLLCRERFDGKETENGEMYDSLTNTNYTGRCYCDRCNAYLGNRENDTVSAKAKKAIIDADR